MNTKHGIELGGEFKPFSTDRTIGSMQAMFAALAGTPHRQEAGHAGMSVLRRQRGRRAQFLHRVSGACGGRGGDAVNIPRWMLSAQLREEQQRTIINTSPAEPEEASVTRACRWAAVIAVVGLALIVLANQVLRG